MMQMLNSCVPIFHNSKAVISTISMRKGHVILHMETRNSTTKSYEKFYLKKMVKGHLMMF